MQINKSFVGFSRNMNTKYVAVFAALAAMLVVATALTTTDNAFATKYKSQAVAQANECGNGFMSENVGCQNTASQIQGDDNRAALASSQQFED
jgi:hypothetical protein